MRANMDNGALVNPTSGVGADERHAHQIRASMDSRLYWVRVDHLLMKIIIAEHTLLPNQHTQALVRRQHPVHDCTIE